MIPRCFLKVLILLILFPPIVFAEDFKTVNGKEYKNATVTGVEADGIVVKTKGGISKVYFAELPKDVQERFHYEPQKAAAAQAAAVRQTEELNQANKQAEELDKQGKAATAKQSQQGLELQAKYNNIQALTDSLPILQQQEQNLLVRIGQAEKAETDARRRWLSGQGGTQYSAPAEAELPVLRGNLKNVREEKQRVKRNWSERSVSTNAEVEFTFPLREPRLIRAVSTLAMCFDVRCPGRNFRICRRANVRGFTAKVAGLPKPICHPRSLDKSTIQSRGSFLGVKLTAG